MDPRLQKGIEFFNTGEFFEAHEIWEDVWVEESGARHAFFQCLIQVAVAMHHASNENWKGTRKLCASSLGYLEKGKTDSKPIDMEKLKDLVLDFDIVVQKRVAGEQGELPFFKLPIKE